MDKEFIILESINNNSMTTQRELSKKLGISLGSINLLINKMVREGLVKIEKANANTILYMLTPEGFVEKVNKTYKYISIHYKYITEIKEKLKCQLSIMNQKRKIMVLLGEDEMSKLVRTAIKELDKPDIILSDITLSIDPELYLIVVLDNEHFSYYKNKGYEVVNLIEQL